MSPPPQYEPSSHSTKYLNSTPSVQCGFVLSHNWVHNQRYPVGPARTKPCNAHLHNKTLQPKTSLVNFWRTFEMYHLQHTSSSSFNALNWCLAPLTQLNMELYILLANM